MEAKKKYRNFPRDTLEGALAVPQKIMDEMGGRPFKRLLLADSLGVSPSSNDFRYLLSSSYQYGFTEGTEKASDIELADIGQAATQNKDSAKRVKALRDAASKPEVFGEFYNDYRDKKMPSPEMLGKILVAEYGVPEANAGECARLLMENGRFTGIIRDIGGSPHVLLDSPLPIEHISDGQDEATEIEPPPVSERAEVKVEIAANQQPSTEVEEKKHRPIFIGHGKNTKPLEKLQKFLTTFQIPYKVTIEEANLGRPIPQKVRETMLQCGSAILIFTCDELFYDEEKNEIWRPSENVVHELGAASLLYEDRIVIFKEKGLHFPTNFQSIGYIEFEVDSIDAKTADLLKELIGFGLVKVTPT